MGPHYIKKLRPLLPPYGPAAGQFGVPGAFGGFCRSRPETAETGPQTTVTQLTNQKGRIR